MAIHESGRELIQCRHLLRGFREAVDEHMSLSVLAPLSCSRFGCGPEHPPFAERHLIRQLEADIDLPSASPVRSHDHGHRPFYLSNDGADFWRSHSTSVSARMSTLRPIL